MHRFLYVLFSAIVACSNDGSEVVNNPPGSFSIQTIATTPTVATLSWTASVDPDGDAVTYQISRNEVEIAKGLTRLNYTFADLIPGTSYSGAISAVDGKGGVTSVAYTFTAASNAPNTSTFNIPSEIASYYSGLDFSKTGTELYDQLATLTITKHKNILEYGERHPYLKKADADLTDNSKVIVIYTGEKRNISEINGNVNTEHVYPQSKIGNTAKGDLHHLRYCDSRVNSNRGNMPFTSGSGATRQIGNGWYPGDDWRGDVARMILYLSLRYNEDLGTAISTEGVSLLLKWNAQDPVSAIEKNRNNVIQGAQGNRNPFIDNPYLATLIWGYDEAQNTWK
ncbi:MAG: endonuclease [Capnocytophaga sp.]|nr:endonuclease [Capnocytophaga sp.]